MKIILTLFIFLFSCSHMKNGRYVRIDYPYDLNALQKIYGVSHNEIVQENADKSLASGEWIFIPWKRGIASSYDSTFIGSHRGNLNLGWPLGVSPLVISSNFGRRGRGQHSGIDIYRHQGELLLWQVLLAK